MLTQVRYKNLKALRDVSIDLQQLTLLVGPNAVGKSTALDGLELIMKLSSQTGRQFAGAEVLRQLGPWHLAGLLRRGAETLSMGVTMTDHRAFSLEVLADSNGEPFRILYRRPDGSELKQPNQANTTERFFSDVHLQGMDSVARLRLDFNQLVTASPAAHDAPTLASDGSGLPTLLQQMATDRDGSLEALEASLRRVVPSFRRVRTKPTSVSELSERTIATSEGGHRTEVVRSTTPGVGLHLDFQHASDVPAAHASEGMILALGILAAVHSPIRRRLILMDDLEHGLHVGAQHRLVEVLKQLLAQEPELQIIGTTHSPDLVDACPPECVRVLGHGPNGTIARPLVDHPEAEKWLKLLRTGEFWSSAGEDWVTTPIVADG